MSSAEQLKHQRDLSVVAELVAADVRTEARKANPGDIDGWWRARGPKIHATVAEGFTTTAAMGAKRLATSALAAGFELDPVAAVVELAQLAVSLRVTGPVAFKTQVARSGSEDAAMRVMVDRLTGSARRLTLAGDRETFWATADASPLLIGYRRVAQSGACKFCEMLAGRGAVYLSAASAGTVVGQRGRPRGNRDLGRSFHDGCSCRIEEIWDENARPAPAAAAPARAFEEEERARARADRLRRRLVPTEPPRPAPQDNQLRRRPGVPPQRRRLRLA